MKKILCFILLLAGIEFSCFAQYPPYYFGTASGNLQGRGLGSTTLKDTVRGGRYQVIYHPSDVNSARNGKIANVYYRVYGSTAGTGSKTVYYKLKIKLGYSPKPVFKGHNAVDTFITELQTVFYKDSINLGDLSFLDSNHWIKFPLNSGNFYFDTSKNVAMEIAQGPPNAKNFIYFSCSNLLEPRMLYGFTDTPTAKTGINTLLDFGFDLDLTGVENVGNLKSFGLFPNPAPAGRFMVSFDSRQAIKVVSIKVRNSYGQEVYQQSYLNVGTNFFKEVNLGSVAAGVYFLELNADGERLARRVIVE